METISNLFEWYLNSLLKPETRMQSLGTTTGIITFILVFILKPSRNLVFRQFEHLKKWNERKKTAIPYIEVKIDLDGTFHQISDKKFDSKIKLARQICFSQKSKGLSINIIPTFSTRKYNKEGKRILEMKLNDISRELETKIMIMLSKQIESGLETPSNVLTVLNGLLEKQSFIVKGKTKIDIYRVHNPKITFSIWLSVTEMQELAMHNNQTVSSFKQELSISQFLQCTIVPKSLLYKRIIPALVEEIYRLYQQENFDIQTQSWDQILNYEIGLG